MMPSVIPIPNHPLLRIPGRSMICCGDIHIGIEAEYSDKGVHMPSQTSYMAREILSVREGERRLMLMGDIKHQVPGSSPQEHAELPSFLMRMAREFERVDVVKGNHDGGIERLLPSRGVWVHPASGFVEEDISFIHGHTWPSDRVMDSSLMIMAHNHPAVMFRDGLGRTSSEPCWLRCGFSDKARRRFTRVPEELIVMPALNPNIIGSPVNINGKKLMGPLFAQEMVDMSQVKVYLLDGIYLGKIPDLLL